MDSSKVKYNHFSPPFVARYVRIQPVDFKQRPALRLELLGCDLNSEFHLQQHNLSVFILLWAKKCSKWFCVCVCVQVAQFLLGSRWGWSLTTPLMPHQFIPLCWVSGSPASLASISRAGSMPGGQRYQYTDVNYLNDWDTDIPQWLHTIEYMLRWEIERSRNRVFQNY